MAKATPTHAKIIYVGDDFQEGLHVVRVGTLVYGPFLSPDKATSFADEHFVGALVHLHPLRHPDQAAEDANV